MNGSLDELYLNWLYSLVADPDESSRSRTYWKLLRQLFTKEFVHIIPRDENRCSDGVDLRVEFAEDLGLIIEDAHWIDMGCSMLELLIGLSRRLSFQAEGEPRDWFWHLIRNLDIRFADRGRYPSEVVEEVLDRVIWRMYNSDGSGGLFPLRRPDCDQRDVELWYQLNAYLLERP